MCSGAVFLDRDGTIAPDVGYCSCPEDFKLFTGAPQAIRLLKNRGLKTVIITNQSGVARGFLTEDTLSLIHQKMTDELKKRYVRIDAVYYCPHHPDDGCQCRKPGTGLFQQAAKEHGIDLEKSFMVGDTQTDIDAGRAAGCRTILVTTGPGQGGDITTPADFTANSLLEAVQWILRNDNFVSPVLTEAFTADPVGAVEVVRVAALHQVHRLG